MKMMALVVWAMLWMGFWQDPSKPEDAATAAGKPTSDTTKKVNPVKTTAESIALGKKAYATDCAMCHGKDGAGDGDLAADMKLKLRDFRNAAAMKELTDGEMFDAIMSGKGQMSGEEGRMKPTQVWNVVNYVRSLGKK
jgi:mono/diheme cytochrome c family protein